MKHQSNLDEMDVALYEVATRYARNNYAFEQRHKLERKDRRFSGKVWQDLAEMGWLGIAVAEDDGGLGLRLSSIAVLSEVAGRMLLAEPLIATGFTGAHLLARLGTRGQREELLPRIMGGATRLAVHVEPAGQLPPGVPGLAVMSDGSLAGELRVVLDADIADGLLLRATKGATQSAVFMVDPKGSGVELQRYSTVDGRGAATVKLDRAPAVQIGAEGAEAETAIHEARLIGALAVAADSLGVMATALETTLEYLKTRAQFGRPIGTNQALQHRAVDMYMQAYEARSVIASAVGAFAAAPEDFARHVHAAKALVDTSARRLVHDAVQMHGGIGLADEFVVTHCLRRLLVNESAYGSGPDHLACFAGARQAAATQH